MYIYSYYLLIFINTKKICKYIFLLNTNILFIGERGRGREREILNNISNVIVNVTKLEISLKKTKMDIF